MKLKSICMLFACAACLIANDSLPSVRALDASIEFSIEKVETFKKVCKTSMGRYMSHEGNIMLKITFKNTSSDTKAPIKLGLMSFHSDQGENIFREFTHCMEMSGFSPIESISKEPANEIGAILEDGEVTAHTTITTFLSVPENTKTVVLKRNGSNCAEIMLE